MISTQSRTKEWIMCFLILKTSPPGREINIENEPA